MDPGQTCIRGLKIGVSNPGLAVILWAASLAAVLLVAFPIGGLGVGAMALVSRISEQATGAEAFLHASEQILEHWGAVMAFSAVATLWIAAVLFALVYVQAGVMGCIVRAHRTAPPGDFSLKPKLGANPAFKVFAMDLLWQEAKVHGWRVTMVATAYSVVVTLLLVLYGAWVALCIWFGMKGEVQVAIAIIAGVFGLFPLILAAVVLGIHYRFAVMCAVQRSLDWREAISAANAVIRARFMHSLAVVGLGIAAGYAVGIAFAIVGIPFAILSMIPIIGLIAIVPRILLGLIQSLVMCVVTVSVLGATAGVCEPIGESGAGAGEKMRVAEAPASVPPAPASDPAPPPPVRDPIVPS